MTSSCVTIVVGSLFAVGLPLAWLLGGRRQVAERDFLRAPFVGLAAIVTVLQNLVYLDVPVRQSTPWLWGFVLLVWLVLTWSGRWRDCLRPGLALAAGGFLAVYLLQGAGLVRLGAGRYVGRCWVDQFNYVAIAQTLSDEPFHFGRAAIENHPVTALTWHMRQDRLGQSVLHAFYAVSCRWDAKSLFEPTILLLPPLTAFAVFALGRRLGLGRLAAALTAGVAAMLPALTLLHLESFLSHALGLPFLLLVPLLLLDVAERLQWGTFLTAALCLTAAFSLYTEFAILLAGLLVVVLGGAAIGHGRWRTMLLCLPGLAVAPVLLLPGYVPYCYHAIHRSGEPACEEVYPWALKLAGLGRLWFGDLPFFAPASVQRVAEIGGLILTFVALTGLGLACVKSIRALRRQTGAEPRAAAVLRLAALLLALLPAAVVLRDREHPYQVYKLLITISPLLVLGLALLLWSTRRVWPKVMLAGAAAAALAGTADMLWRSTRSEQVPRTIAWMLLDPNMMSVARRMEKESGSGLVIATSDVGINPWLAYYGRRNRIWLNAGDINLNQEASWPGGHLSLFHVTEAPPNCLVLGSKFRTFDTAPPPGAHLEWANDAYQLWRTTGRTWALPANFQHNIGPEQLDGRPFFWIGYVAVALEVVAGCPTTVTLRGHLVLGPAQPPRQLLLTTDHGWTAPLHPASSELALDVPVPAGKTVLTLAVAGVRPEMEPRGSPTPPFLLGVHGLRLSLTPQWGMNSAPACPEGNREQSRQVTACPAPLPPSRPR
jgi:hypothetical protein